MGSVGGRGSHTILYWTRSVSLIFFSFFLLYNLFIFLRDPSPQNYDIKSTYLFYHRFSSDYEKIIAAAADFASGRVWPVNFASESGPKFVWEKVD